VGYTLTDEDVVVYEGFIEACFYDFSQTDIIIPEWLDKQKVIGIEGSRSFSKRGITSVKLPKTLEYIGVRAFSDNKLSHIDIPLKVKEIDREAFSFNQLEKVVLYENVKKVKDFAFAFNNIQSVQFNRKTDIEPLAFNNNSVQLINGQKTNGLLYKADSLGNEDRTVLKAYWGASRTIDFLPSTIDSILMDVFLMQNINILVLPEGLKYIGGAAFKDNNLTKVVIPSSVEKIDRYAFMDCNIEQLIIKDGLRFIGREAFSNNKISNLSLPNSLQVIEKKTTKLRISLSSSLWFIQ
jgi:hypothetical protein